MKTLVVAIQKGGQGKTFAACHLAFDFRARGLRVVVIDLDTQGNASFTLSARNSGFFASQLFLNKPNELRRHFSGNDGLTLIAADSKLANLDKAKLSKAAGALQANIAALGEYYDVCFIDTAPSLGVAMTSAILNADYMLSPIEVEAYSLHGMGKMVNVINNLRQQNPKLKFIGLLPNRVELWKQRQRANLIALRQKYPKLILPISVGKRDSIAEALGEGMPVWKMKKSAARKAKKEVRAMTDYVYTAMEIAQ
jgi:chromosome partitioning protein